MSGCHGARTSATQQWEQMTDFKPCSDWRKFLKNSFDNDKKLDCMGLRGRKRLVDSLKVVAKVSPEVIQPELEQFRGKGEGGGYILPHT